MLELVDSEAPPTVEVAPVEVESIAEIVDDIRNVYCKRCIQFTGQALDETDVNSDRRIEPRDSITIPFYLRPARGDSEIPPVDRSHDLIAVTRDLTHRGIGFQCDEPLDERFYVAEFDGATAEQVRLLIEIRWRHQKSSHHFIAGCRILCPLYK